MPNNFFDLSTPEKYAEAYDKWMRLTLEESAALNAPKSRIYVSVEGIKQLQEGLEAIIKYHTELGISMAATYERRIMQMGYNLEEIKHKLQKRINTSDKNRPGDK